MRRWIVAGACALLGCGYQPARFRPGPVVAAVDDRAPIPMPERRRPLRELFVAETHADAHFVAAWRASPPARARDVNRRDAVVGSSWFCPRTCVDARDAPSGWRPREMESPFDDHLGLTLRTTDGEDLVMLVDPPTFGRLRSTALVVASRLAGVVGYRAAPFFPATSPGGEPAAVARWSADRDLGSTPLFGTRGDDPNDTWRHEDRRSLRAFSVFAAWVGMTRYDASTFRDVYVGAPGEGHVEHWVLGLQDALGVGWYRERREDALDLSRDDVGFGGRLATLGLTPRPPPPDVPDASPAAILEEVTTAMGELSPPFPPGLRLRRDDAFWMAKRIAAVDRDTIAAAVAAAELPAAEATALVALLEVRRDTVAATAFAMVTPLDPVAARPGRLLLRDLAPELDPSRQLTATFYTQDGQRRAPSPTVKTRQSRVVVDYDPALLPTVLRIHRTKEPRDRAVEIHLDRDGLVEGVVH